MLDRVSTVLVHKNSPKGKSKEVHSMGITVAFAQKLYGFIKRFLDIFFSTVLLVFFTPVIATTSLLVKIKLGSPIFFKQQRPGLNGNLFTILKFRTMSVSPANVSSELDGSRLSSFGSRLRSTSLDELPSLWNVLRGDMSFVGPRPLLVKYLSEYTPEQAQRHLVRPGITGLAQVSGRNSLTWEERFKLDVYYVKNFSLFLDLRILFFTIITVFRRDGISALDHATMHEFISNQGKK